MAFNFGLRLGYWSKGWNGGSEMERGWGRGKGCVVGGRGVTGGGMTGVGAGGGG